MDEERIKRMMEDEYDPAREDTVFSMIGDFYSRKMLSTAILVWVVAIICAVPAVYSAVKFFGTDDTQWQILYATIFIVCFEGIGLMKVYAWEMIHRHSVKREIKRLELRIAELASALRPKQ